MPRAADIFWKTALVSMRTETEHVLPPPNEEPKGPGDQALTARSRRLMRLREELMRRGGRGAALAQTGDPDQFPPLVECVGGGA